jgi:hypothetical protein
MIYNVATAFSNSIIAFSIMQPSATVPITTSPTHNSSLNTRTHAPRSSAPAPPSSPPLPSSGNAYSNSIHGAADRLIHLFNAEISQEIQATCAHLKAERERILRERIEIKQEREAVEREREIWRQGGKFAEDVAHASERLKDKEIGRLRSENQKLKVQIQALQVRLGDISTRGPMVEGSHGEP